MRLKGQHREPVRCHVLSADEERRYFAELDKDPGRYGNLADAARLMLHHGMRLREVLNLRKQDVDLRRNQIVSAAKWRRGRGCSQ